MERFKNNASNVIFPVDEIILIVRKYSVEERFHIVMESFTKNLITGCNIQETWYTFYSIEKVEGGFTQGVKAALPQDRNSDTRNR